MQPKVVGNLISSMLYEKRFGPWLAEPVAAGLDKDQKPFVCAFVFIGAMSKADDFVVSGTSSE
jgi:20S proteasome subunit beta 3